ncbi:MAG: DUF4229 domain-containing protein [Desulfobacteraceae bacterium]|nr:DUF4229 domain-containing protein [Desulfobacteraceae bacterium]
MVITKKCYCLLAVATALVVVVGLAYLQGYQIPEWSLLTFAAIIAIVLAVFVCNRCRQQEDEQDPESTKTDKERE